jgi:hypothetical protein
VYHSRRRVGNEILLTIRRGGVNVPGLPHAQPFHHFTPTEKGFLTQRLTNSTGADWNRSVFSFLDWDGWSIGNVGALVRA